MSEMPHSPEPEYGEAPQPRPFSEVISLWFEVFRMSENFFVAEAPSASSASTFFGVLVYAFVSALLLMLQAMLFGAGQFEELISAFGADSILAGMGSIVFCYLCSGFISVPLGFYLSNALWYLGARLLGGRGDYTTQAYLISLYLVPLGIISQMLNMIPWVGFILSAIVGILILILTIRAMKVTHSIGTGSALIAVLWPSILGILFGCCIFALLVSTIGATLPDILQGLEGLEGIEGFPTP